MINEVNNMKYDDTMKNNKGKNNGYERNKYEGAPHRGPRGPESMCS